MIKVLLVDDSKFMAKGIQTILEGLDFDVVGVGFDGIQGLELFEQLHPDVTLLDITMPNMDGVECLQRIRQIDPEACVVMLSAIRDPETIERCISSGASSFLQKPIRPGSPADLSRLCDTIEGSMKKAVQQ